MKNIILKTLVVGLLLTGLIWYMSYRGSQSPVYVIMHFPEELNRLFHSLIEGNQSVEQSQLDNY